MLSRSAARGGALVAAVALVALAFVPATPSDAAATPAAGGGRVLGVAPALGLPGLAVRFSGAGVPRRVTYRVYFDVTTSDKVLVCSGTDGTRTTWRCTGRIPHRYGALGLHTVEMDATPATGTHTFEELSTFLVTDLGVTMAAPATTAPGDTVEFRITVANGNATAAHDVRVTDALPAGLRLERASAPCALRAGAVRCGPLRLGVRTTRVLTLTAVVTTAHRTHLFDRVSITGSPDPLRGNDTVRVELTVA